MMVDIPTRCRKCQNGEFNDFWCIFTSSDCYVESVKQDENGEVISEDKGN